MGSDLGVSHCQAGDESVCDHVCDFQWIRFDCVGRRVIEIQSGRGVFHSRVE